MPNITESEGKRPMNTRLLQRAGILLCLTLCLCACTAPVVSPDADDLNLPNTKNTCPGLDSALYQLTQAEDPLKTAQELDMNIQEDRLQVVLVLEDEDTALPEGFDLEAGTRVGNEVQVFAPVNQLCDLAAAEGVMAVNRPAQPIY
jgi:hypothetical protein